MIHLNSPQAEVEVFDAAGFLRKSLVTDKPSLMVPITDLKSGVYFLRIKTREQIQTTKFIKI
jgi:hypothetical protein